MIEKLRAEFTMAPNLDARKVIARKIQEQAVETGPYVPVGQFWLVRGQQASLQGLLSPGAPVYWNVSKSRCASRLQIPRTRRSLRLGGRATVTPLQIDPARSITPADFQPEQRRCALDNARRIRLTIRGDIDTRFRMADRMIEIRSFLRSETTELHRELDAIVGEFSNRADYARFLQGTFRHRAPVETALTDAATTTGSIWRPRRLLAMLEQDLEDLAVPPSLAEPFHLSNDIASFLGAAYVLEGSTLGARILVKEADALGFGPGFGARYLSAQASSLDSWRHLLVELDRLDRQQWDAAAQSARSVFTHAIQAFSSEALSTA